MYYPTVPVNRFAQQSSLTRFELPMQAAVVNQVRASNQLETAADKTSTSLTKVRQT